MPSSKTKGTSPVAAVAAAKPLNPREEAFCLEILKDFNATRSASDAGYTKNPKAAAVQGHKLMSDERIQKRIKELNGERMAALKLSAEDVLRAVSEIADADPALCFNQDGGLLPIHEIPIATRKTIASIKVSEIWEGAGRDKYQAGELKEIRFWNKNSSQELMAKHHGLVSDRSDVKVQVTYEDMIGGSYDDKDKK